MTDPVLERRARMARLAALGQRIGYGALLVAIGAFVWALAAHFPSAAVTLVVIGMVVFTLTLAPAMILGYSVKAAEREDRESAANRDSMGHGGAGPE